MLSANTIGALHLKSELARYLQIFSEMANLSSMSSLERMIHNIGCKQSYCLFNHLSKISALFVQARTLKLQAIHQSHLRISKLSPS